MDQRIIFLFLAIPALFFGVDIGDSVHQLHTEEILSGNDATTWKLWSVVSIACAGIGFAFYFWSIDTSVKDQFEQFLCDAGPVIAAFGGSTTYGIFAGPFWQFSENPWAGLSGYLVFVLLGLIPAVLTINNLALDKAERRRLEPR